MQFDHVDSNQYPNTRLVEVHRIRGQGERPRTYINTQPKYDRSKTIQSIFLRSHRQGITPKWQAEAQPQVRGTPLPAMQLHHSVSCLARILRDFRLLSDKRLLIRRRIMFDNNSSFLLLNKIIGLCAPLRKRNGLARVRGTQSGVPVRCADTWCW